MRETKFRGKKEFSSEWVYGYFLVNHYGEYTICGKDFAAKVLPETVGEYTGIKDKNFKEIYEDDIVMDCRENVPITNLYYLVGFRKGMFGMDCDPDLWWEDVAVTGNKFENPELIKCDEELSGNTNDDFYSEERDHDCDD